MDVIERVREVEPAIEWTVGSNHQLPPCTPTVLHEKVLIVQAGVTLANPHPKYPASTEGPALSGACQGGEAGAYSAPPFISFIIFFRGRTSASSGIQTSSMRRFSAFPSVVSLPATGLESP